MKRSLLARLFFISCCIATAAGAAAQHFIAVQSENKQPYTLNINGVNLSAAKNGAVRISSLSAGTYTLVISSAAQKIAPQTFICTLDKEDQTYLFKNLGAAGWVLRNVKNGKVLAAVKTASVQPANAAAVQQIDFAHMLAQVANDPDLLTPTAWVYSNKPELPDGYDTSMPQAPVEENTAYVSATKGIIKAREEDVKGGTEMVFVDFNSNGGDTIHLIIPNTDVADNNTPDTLAVAKAAPVVDTALTAKNISVTDKQPQQTAADSSQVTAPAVTPPPTGNGDSLAVVKKLPPHPAAADTAQQVLIDTTENRPLGNPFFNKDSAATAPAISKPDTTEAAAGTAAPAIKGNAVAANTQSVVPGATAGNNATTAPVFARPGCDNMLNDKALDKLKHKIYLETDEKKMVDVATKFLKDKCITTQQVKDLGSYFLNDEARLNFFKAVYPFVYDYGNFTTLETYLIDKHYKEQFRAFLK
jgi:hypothetical protein